MKRSLNFWLMVIFLLSIPLCVASWLWDIRWLLVLPGVSFFCLQLFLCRRYRRRFPRALPTLVVLLAALCGLYIMLTCSGWDTLGGLILLLACIAPAVGILAAWLIFFLLRRRAAAKED